MMQRIMTLAVLGFTCAAHAQNIKVEDMQHIFRRTQEESYMIKYLAAKGLKYAYNMPEALYVEACLKDTSDKCDKVVYDKGTNVLKHFTHNEDAYIRWSYQMLGTGYYLKSVISDEELNVSAYELYGTTVLLTKDLRKEAAYPYYITIYED